MRDMTPGKLKEEMEKLGYISNEELVLTTYLALKMERPLLVEGAPGVGKTEIAKVLSDVFDTDLIRLQCYEGLDETKSLYEWNYQRQLLKIQLSQNEHCSLQEKDLFSEEFLLERPLLKAIRADRKVVLLIDEVDKVDEPFEAFLFELLSDFQVSIPELGTLVAKQIPIVVLTSNSERLLSDGLKRRCIYLYIDYPTVEKEMRILQARVPEAGERLRREISHAVNIMRAEYDLNKKPSIAETIDWARALHTLGIEELSEDAINSTLNILLKNREDHVSLLNSNGGAKSIMSYVRSQMSTR